MASSLCLSLFFKLFVYFLIEIFLGVCISGYLYVISYWFFLFYFHFYFSFFFYMLMLFGFPEIVGGEWNLSFYFIYFVSFFTFSFDFSEPNGILMVLFLLLSFSLSAYVLCAWLLLIIFLEGNIILCTGWCREKVWWLKTRKSSFECWIFFGSLGLKKDKPSFNLA